tara:strand:+ start:16491 stop:16898 length:408 start_codon:yes stop_codon:yes gene_type:complete
MKRSEMVSKFQLLLYSFLALKILTFDIQHPSKASEIYCSDSTNFSEVKGCSNYKDINSEFDSNFYKHSYFLEDTLNPFLQIGNLFGIGGFRDQKFIKESMLLWKTFEVHSANQTSYIKKYTQDIPSGYNGSLLDN